jgi:hypothetical protein
VIAAALNAGVHGGQSIVSVVDPEIDRLDAAILTVPRPFEYAPRLPEIVPRNRWHRAGTIVMVAIPLLAFVAAFPVYVVDLFTHNFAPGARYFFLLNCTIQILLWVVICFGAKEFERRFKLRQSRKPSMTIFPSGIALEDQFVTWENIASCRWNLYIPRTLVIAVNSRDWRCTHAVPVPETHRALVEGTFRRFGKWDEPWAWDESEKIGPGPVDENASETGMHINFRTADADSAPSH